jgi:hypothetical protein
MKETIPAPNILHFAFSVLHFSLILNRVVLGLDANGFRLSQIGPIRRIGSIST